MAKIAVDLEHAVEQRAIRGTSGGISARRLAQGDDWVVDDLICTSGPGDPSFEERHVNAAIAIVAAGTFQYRSRSGRELMTPGSLLLGNPDQPFECGHDHGTGDRCISFRYTPDGFERLAAEAGAPRPDRRFRAFRLPPVRELSPLIARVSAAVTDSLPISWEEMSLRLLSTVVHTAGGLSPRVVTPSTSALARVTEIVRAIEDAPSVAFSIRGMAQDARLSPYHFLRTFESLTGVTPHQYVRRVRLRHAAARLASERTKVIDVAFDSGFGDVSNFNRAFRAEFGVSPSRYRAG